MGMWKLFTRDANFRIAQAGSTHWWVLKRFSPRLAQIAVIVSAEGLNIGALWQEFETHRRNS